MAAGRDAPPVVGARTLADVVATLAASTMRARLTHAVTVPVVQNTEIVGALEVLPLLPVGWI